jgi:hypothetical protein
MVSSRRIGLMRKLYLIAEFWRAPMLGHLSLWERQLAAAAASLKPTQTK